MWRYVVLWLGQVVSLIGTQLTGFALGVWAFKLTGSVFAYALFALATMAPQALAAPLAGVVIDRWTRKMALIAGHGLAGVCTLFLAFLYFGDSLALWAMLLIVGFGSLFNSVLNPAFAAATTMLVEPNHLGRANGMVQLGFALAWLVAPATAGALMPVIDIKGILLIDVSTFTVAILVTLASRIPEPAEHPHHARSRPRVSEQLVFGLRYLWQNPGLLGLIVFLGVINFNLGMVYVLITPLVLSFADETAAGAAISIGGTGMLLASVFMIVVPGPRTHRVWAIIVCLIAQGLMLLLGAAQPNTALIAAGAFGVMATVPFIAGYSEVIWQRKVPPEAQGRVFSIKTALVTAFLPLAFLIAGPLADYLFEPAMLEGGFLAPMFGPLVGVGPGRGIALMISVLGLVTIASVAVGLHPRVRRLEREMPDHDQG